LNVVVTAGATREAIDPVRFISNHSTGKMGVALAQAAWRRGAQVTLVAGHLDVPVPTGIDVVHAETVSAMKKIIEDILPSTDVLIMAAAPADFRPSAPAAQKIKKSSQSARTPEPIELTETEDILKSTQSARKAGSVVVGFALETENLLANSEAKLRQKGLDMIVANSAVDEGTGFGGDTNRVTILSAGGATEEIAMMKKTELADVILDRVEAVLNGR
ncbi:MAG TPA: phosphopantothenoylcysteine decarboxylase, partial [Gemmatimonadaceae bacterium]|nr:phosphopantothenoylcysteine decarboxylase [Gemmatimonadaceae bacterium]